MWYWWVPFKINHARSLDWFGLKRVFKKSEYWERNYSFNGVLTLKVAFIGKIVRKNACSEKVSCNLITEQIAKKAWLFSLKVSHKKIFNLSLRRRHVWTWTFWLFFQPLVSEKELFVRRFFQHLTTNLNTSITITYAQRSGEDVRIISSVRVRNLKSSPVRVKCYAEYNYCGTPWLSANETW